MGGEDTREKLTHRARKSSKSVPKIYQTRNLRCARAHISYTHIRYWNFGARRIHFATSAEATRFISFRERFTARSGDLAEFRTDVETRGRANSGSASSPREGEEPCIRSIRRSATDNKTTIATQEPVRGSFPAVYPANPVIICSPDTSVRNPTAATNLPNGEGIDQGVKKAR